MKHLRLGRSSCDVETGKVRPFSQRTVLNVKNQYRNFIEKNFILNEISDLINFIGGLKEIRSYFASNTPGANVENR